MCDLFGTKAAANRVADAASEQAQLQREAEAKQQADLLAQQQNVADQQTAAENARVSEMTRIANEQKAAAEAQAQEVRDAEARRQAGIASGVTTISDLFGQFNDDFYNNRAKSYVDYAKPQLDQQYQTAMQSLVRSLARTGNLNSSVRGSAMADVKQQYDRGILSLQDQGIQYANNARSSVEAARGNLLAQNSQIADPGVVGNLARAQAGSLSSSPTYSPLQTLINAFSSSSGTESNTGSNLPGKSNGVALFSTPSSATGTTVA